MIMKGSHFVDGGGCHGMYMYQDLLSRTLQMLAQTDSGGFCTPYKAAFVARYILLTHVVLLPLSILISSITVRVRWQLWVGMGMESASHMSHTHFGCVS